MTQIKRIYADFLTAKFARQARWTQSFVSFAVKSVTDDTDKTDFTRIKKVCENLRPRKLSGACQIFANLVVRVL